MLATKTNCGKKSIPLWSAAISKQVLGMSKIVSTTPTWNNSVATVVAPTPTTLPTEAGNEQAWVQHIWCKWNELCTRCIFSHDCNSAQQMNLHKYFERTLFAGAYTHACHKLISASSANNLSNKCYTNKTTTATKQKLAIETVQLSTHMYMVQQEKQQQHRY